MGTTVSNGGNKQALDDVKVEEINRILVSPKTYKQFAENNRNTRIFPKPIGGFEEFLFHGIRIQESNLVKNGEYLIIPKLLTMELSADTKKQLKILLKHDYSQKNYKP